MVDDFPRTLHLLRVEKKISQRRAALDLGVSQALLSHYENGVREPGLSFVVRAADYYGVSADYLLGRTMLRDGGAIIADDLIDSSLDKGNVLRGSAYAMLSKKLLVNGISILFELIGKHGSNKLITSVSDYLSTAFYKAYRLVYQLDRDSRGEAFSVSGMCYSELCDARMKLCEGALRELGRDKEVGESLPDMDIGVIQQGYPQLAPSLFSLLHNVSEKIEKSANK